jgi:hypothetical protein
VNLKGGIDVHAHGGSGAGFFDQRLLVAHAPAAAVLGDIVRSPIIRCSMPRGFPISPTWFAASPAATGGVSADVYQAVHPKRASTKNIELDTGYASGARVHTTNLAASPFLSPPQFHTLLLPADAPLNELLARHRQRKAEYKKAHPGDAVVRIQNLEDTFVFAKRCRQAVCEHRAALSTAQLQGEIQRLLPTKAPQFIAQVRLRAIELRDAPDALAPPPHEQDGPIGTRREEFIGGLRSLHAAGSEKRKELLAKVAAFLTKTLAEGFPPSPANQPSFDSDVVLAMALRLLDGEEVERQLPVCNLRLALPALDPQSIAKFRLPSELVKELGLRVG